MTVSYFDIRSENQVPKTKVAEGETILRDRPVLGKVDLEHVTSEVWDSIASRFADLIPEQMGSFNVGHWGTENLEFLIFKHNGETIGGASILVKKIPFTSTGVAILKWGPVFQRAGKEFDAVLYSKIIDSLKKEYCVRRNFHLTVMPAARVHEAEECESILTAQGFQEGEYLPAPERYLVNVKDCPDTLMKNLDQKWRYNLRKALKNELEFRVAAPEEGLTAFLELYQKMLDRKRFNDASAIGALKQVITNSPKGVRPLIVLVSHEGKITAGGVFHVAGDVASYMFGATDERALKLKAGYALHWWVAEHLISRKYIDWYDLGGNDRDKGLHQFKKGFVGKSGHILISPPRYHFANSVSAKLVGFAAFKARNLLASTKGLIHQIQRNK